MSVAAQGWIEVLTEVLGAEDDMLTPIVEHLGTTLSLCVIAAAPAIFEEIAFRGLLQARLAALLGRYTGILTTAMLFALAHGISYASPLHLAIGVYLGFLRDRCGSLLPGMLLHALYNGSIVLMIVYGPPFG